jgi:hypothetical protein
MPQIALPILENQPPRTFKLYTWAQHIDPGTKPATPRFVTELRDLVAEAKQLYQTDTGQAPAKIALRDPVRTLGPDWHLRQTGTHGAFNHLIVLRDPKLGRAEFALSR